MGGEEARVEVEGVWCEDVEGEDMCKGGGVRGSGVRVWEVRMCKGGGVGSCVRVWEVHIKK